MSESLKRVRKSRDLSLDQLALRSGVSRAALSQIEGGRTNPTLSVLWKVAVGLGIPFPELLEMPEGSTPRVMRAGDAVALRSADGRMESRLLSPGGATPSVEVYELRFSAKGLHRSEPHSKGTTETLVVLKGALRITVEGGDHELMTGDTIFFPADVPHAYENQRHSENALAVAKALEKHKAVSWVRYPGLESSVHHARAKKYLPKGAGAILGFGIQGGATQGRKFIDSLKLISHVANVGDARSLAIHPATTTHQQLAAKEQLSTGVSPDFVRLSIGLEHVDDILADIAQALAKAV